MSRASSRSLNPVPVWPTYSEVGRSRYTPSSSAPKYDRVLRGSVQPPMTNSCSWTIFSLRQSGVRLPDWYFESTLLGDQPFPAAGERALVQAPAVAADHLADAQERVEPVALNSRSSAARRSSSGRSRRSVVALAEEIERDEAPSAAGAAP